MTGGDTTLTEEEKQEAYLQFSQNYIEPEVIVNKKNLPQFFVDFNLGSFKLSLVDNLSNNKGMSMFFNDLNVQASLFDSENYHNINSIKLEVVLQEFGVKATESNNGIANNRVFM
jgi:hypothetical protein